MKAFALFGALMLPMLASAQTINSVQNLASFIITLINNVFVPVVFALAFLVFIWGVFKYLIQGASDEKSRGEGGKLILASIIGFFVMISVWGLVRILTGTFRFDSTDTVRQQELPNAPPIIR
jgi:hypothetical protein